MSKVIIRTTQFKVAKDDEAQLAKFYATMKQDAKKDGKPYIISNVAGPAFDDPRCQGYTFVAQTIFGSREDMAYYDDGDEAHAALKTWAKGKLQGPPLMTYFEADMPSS